MPDYSNHPMQSTVSSELNNFMVQNDKDYSNFGYWLTGVDVTHQNLNQMTPFIKGYARLFMLRTPYFMEKGFPRLTQRFKSYIETGFKSVSGLSDLSVDFNTFEGGYGNQQYSTVQMAKDDTTTVTITVYEMSGSPVGEFLRTWITGVRDPRTEIAHYHGMVKGPMDLQDDTKIAYSEQNHTAEFIYLVTDPTGKFIEYACMFAHCFPTKDSRDHYNYSSGDHGETEIDVEFNCTKYESRYINDVAAYYLYIDTLKWNYLDFDPHITAEEIAASNTTFSGAGTATV